MVAKILKFFIGLTLVVGAAGGGLYMHMSGRGLPVYDGVVSVPPKELGADATIYRDSNGVAHIVAKTENDAYYALGYAHAQERLFEMHTIRLYSQGRMTELAGDMKGRGGFSSTLEQDKFFRVIGLKHIGETSIQNIDPESLAILKSYAAGVNRYIHTAKSLPPEFMLVGKPEDWKPTDTLIMGRLIAWFLSHNWDREILQQRLIAEAGLIRGTDLLPKHPYDGPYIIEPSVRQYEPFGKVIEKYPLPLPEDIFSGKVAAALLQLKDASGNGPFSSGLQDSFGSNNWVVSGAHTKSGAPILANDPHLDHMLPSIFYQTHLKTDDGLDAIGVSFPGMPFIALGHNRDVAWGATTTRADTQDIFVEQLDPIRPDQYIHNEESLKFETREEFFKIKEGKKFRAEKIVVRSTIHGPIINDIVPQLGKNAPLIALAWSGQYRSNDVLGFFNISRSKTALDVKKALGQIGQPVQNWVFADREGNIGYFASGLYPVRVRGDGTLPVPGWTGQYDWNGFVPYEMLPQLYDPRNGMIVSANNVVVPEKDYPFIVSFNYSYNRAGRIRQLLESKKKLTPDDMAAIQNDRLSHQGERLAKLFAAAYKQKGDPKNTVAAKAADILNNWDYITAADKPGEAVFISCYQAALELILFDEVSEELAKELLSEQAAQGVYDLWIEKGDSIFIDDRRTPVKETREDILARAVEIGAARLARKLGPDPSTWTWGKIHQLAFVHPMSEFAIPGTNIHPLKVLFPAFHIESAGSHDTVFMSHFGWFGDSYKATVGPCFRQIIDMSDIPGARMIIDTGQSGHPKSKHFFDQNPKWLKGEYIPMEMDIEKVKAQNAGTLVLTPKQIGK